MSSTYRNTIDNAFIWLLCPRMMSCDYSDNEEVRARGKGRWSEKNSSIWGLDGWRHTKWKVVAVGDGKFKRMKLKSLTAIRAFQYNLVLNHSMVLRCITCRGLNNSKALLRSTTIHCMPYKSSIVVDGRHHSHSRSYSTPLRSDHD